MDTFDVSVIVPIYNVEEYLRPCLDSLLRQKDVRIQAILVDDGSTDSSGRIAEEYAETYENFVCYHIENGGLGHARNVGVSYAKGKYLAFLDSDDKVVRGIYGKMFRAAERTGAEMAACNVLRFNSKKVWACSLQARAFLNANTVTNLFENHNLIYDASACNKLILRNFYINNKFSFPEHMVYEEIPTVIPMYALCKKVCILKEMGYLWRIRDGASKSITQNNTSVSNLMDRIKSIRMLEKFFHEHIKEPAIQKDIIIRQLELDLKIFVDLCAQIPKNTALEMFSILNAYMDSSIPRETFSDLSAMDQQKYAYVRAKDLEGLLRLLSYQKTYFSTAPVTETKEGLVAELPGDLFTVASRNVTKMFRDYPPRKWVDRVVNRKNGFEIVAHIYWRRFNLRDSSEQEVKACLFREETGERIPLPVLPERSAELTDHFGKVISPDTGACTQYNYDGAGFRILVDFSRLEERESMEGVYSVLVSYKNRLFRGEEILRGIDRIQKGKCDGELRIVGDWTATMQFGWQDEMQFLCRKDRIFLERMEVADGVLSFATSRRAEGLYLKEKGAPMETAIFPDTGDGISYRVPGGVLGDGMYYLCAADPESGKESYVLGRRQEGKLLRDPGGSFVYVLLSYRTSVVKLQRRKGISYVTAFRRDGERLLLQIRGMGERDLSALSGRARLEVRDSIADCPAVLASSAWAPEGGVPVTEFMVDFGDGDITGNLYAGTRDLHISYESKEGLWTPEDVYCTEDFRHLFREGTLSALCYRSMFATLRVQLQQLWPEEEDSNEKRKAIAMERYPRFMEEPIRQNQILFESMWGSKYSCNPQALYEYIDKNYPEFECIWSFNDERWPIPGRGKRVRRGSMAYYHALATSKYLVNNVNFPDYYVKREGQIEIQTMHGMPLKTLGLEAASEFPTEESRQKYIGRTSRWDYLLVQGRFMEGKAYDCHHFTKTILPVGYPRTDRLFAKIDQGKQKEALGIPADKKVILYAPTWRAKDRFDMKMDLVKMREALSGEYALMIRLHHFSVKGYRIPADGEFIFNMNNYRYVEHLYQIADILITDYSSVMFDFALLDKPMLFFTYDLEDYRDTLRGMYVDMEKECPGPMLRTTEEIIDSIQNIEDVQRENRERYRAFKEKYLTYEGGGSCERIVREVMVSRK